MYFIGCSKCLSCRTTWVTWDMADWPLLCQGILLLLHRQMQLPHGLVSKSPGSADKSARLEQYEGDVPSHVPHRSGPPAGFVRRQCSFLTEVCGGGEPDWQWQPKGVKGSKAEKGQATQSPNPNCNYSSSGKTPAFTCLLPCERDAWRHSSRGNRGSLLHAEADLGVSFLLRQLR